PLPMVRTPTVQVPMVRTPTVQEITTIRFRAYPKKGSDPVILEGLTPFSDRLLRGLATTWRRFGTACDQSLRRGLVSRPRLLPNSPGPAGHPGHVVWHDPCPGRVQLRNGVGLWGWGHPDPLGPRVPRQPLPWHRPGPASHRQGAVACRGPGSPEPYPASRGHPRGVRQPGSIRLPHRPWPVFMGPWRG